MTWGSKDDVTYLDIELELVLEILLVSIMFFIVSVLETS
jgi:hypothetical protein